MTTDLPTVPNGGIEGTKPDDLAISEEQALADGVSLDQPEGPQIPGLPDVESAAAAASDTGQALAEDWSLGSYKTPEELAQIAANDEHDRDRRFRDAFELIAICSVNVAYFALATLSLVWALHLVLPREARWLSPEDLNHLQTLFTAGVLVGVVGNHFKKRLG